MVSRRFLWTGALLVGVEIAGLEDARLALRDWEAEGLGTAQLEVDELRAADGEAIGVPEDDPDADGDITDQESEFEFPESPSSESVSSESVSPESVGSMVQSSPGKLHGSNESGGAILVDSCGTRLEILLDVDMIEIEVLLLVDEATTIAELDLLVV